MTNALYNRIEAIEGFAADVALASILTKRPCPNPEAMKTDGSTTGLAENT